VQIDVRLDEIVLRALEEKPELRFQTASEMGKVTATAANQIQPQASLSGRKPNPTLPGWLARVAVALAVPFVVLVAMVGAWLMLNRGWNGSRHEIVFVIGAWLGILALVLAFLSLLRAGRQTAGHSWSKTSAGPPPWLRVVLWSMLATLLVVAVGRIVFAVRSEVPEIESVVVTRDRAVVKQRNFSGEGMTIAFDSTTNRWTPGSLYLETMFDVTIEWPWFSRHGANWVVKTRHGIHWSYKLDGPPGPMLGKIVFHPGTPAPEADGSYVIGEFRPDNGEPFPIAVRLEAQKAPTKPQTSSAVGDPSAGSTLGLFLTHLFGSGREAMRNPSNRT
jgi:hypothetical protein